jgi:hypothetical protein
MTLLLGHRHSERPKELVLSEVEGSGATEGACPEHSRRESRNLHAEVTLAIVSGDSSTRDARSE